MTYFIGHCIHLKYGFVPFSVIPIHLLSLGDTICTRSLTTDNVSVQLFWQPYSQPRCGAPAIIKTSYIRLIQNRWRSYIKWRKQYYNPLFFKKRECNIK